MWNKTEIKHCSLCSSEITVILFQFYFTLFEPLEMNFIQICCVSDESIMFKTCLGQISDSQYNLVWPVLWWNVTFPVGSVMCLCLTDMMCVVRSKMTAFLSFEIQPCCGIVRVGVSGALYVWQTGQKRQLFIAPLKTQWSCLRCLRQND